MNPSRDTVKKGKIDIEKLIKDNPNDPQIGQGYNDARGDFQESDDDSAYKNRKNNLGPEQKKKK